jgi:hypothetical protein
LVRQQGYMLAQIVAEIHAPDLAVGDDEDLFGSAHHHAEEAYLSCTCVHVLEVLLR